MSLQGRGKEPTVITTEFEGEKYLSLHPRTKDNLLNHVKGNAYWVEFGGEGQSAYHVRDEGGLEYPVEFLNDQGYQLTWGASGYWTSTSSVILPGICIRLGLGWYRPKDRRYQELLPPTGVIVSEKGKERSMDLHSPRSPEAEDDESEDNSPLGILVEESPMEESPVEKPVRTGTPMPGEWKMNLEERIQSAQLKHMVKISDKGIDEPLPEPRLFPEASTIAFSKALKNIENIPPQKLPLISPAAIGALSSSAHIFQLQAVFSADLWTSVTPRKDWSHNHNHTDAPPERRHTSPSMEWT